MTVSHSPSHKDETRSEPKQLTLALLSQQQRNNHSGVLRNAARQKHCVVQHFASRLRVSNTHPASAADVLPRNARKFVATLSRFGFPHTPRSMFSIVVFDAAFFCEYISPNTNMDISIIDLQSHCRTTLIQMYSSSRLEPGLRETTTRKHKLCVGRMQCQFECCCCESVIVTIRMSLSGLLLTKSSVSWLKAVIETNTRS